ncbi:hypothetical protein GS400_19290 [Pontibacillus sp. HMF3514]|nr:hypothetical protein GS400_19290 [Pontibacillus sp. HMF3514]
MHQILNQLPNHIEGRFIIGIDGLSRSGKTTLVKQLSQQLSKRNLPFHLFHIDNHIVERSKRYQTGHEEWYEYYHLQWDVGWLREHFFKPLRSAQQLTLPYYDSGLDTQHIHKIKLSDTTLVLIEGVFLQRKEWRKFFDKIIYLDCPRDIRFSREDIESQKNKEKFQNRYWKAESYYVQTEEPIEKADLVIRG